jgi:sorbitol-specific phosphotransferase system component IIC
MVCLFRRGPVRIFMMKMVWKAGSSILRYCLMTLLAILFYSVPYCIVLGDKAGPM